MQPQPQDQNNNEEIIDRLLREQKQSGSQDVLSPDKQLLITTSRVVSIRYRVYFLILLLAIALFGSYVLFPAWDTFQNTTANLHAVNLEVDAFQTKKLQLDADAALIAKMESGADTIISCLNERVGCNDIDQSIKNNFSFARSYIQLNNLSDPKMVINEKILLANINDYLLRETNGSKNGAINTIAIGESKQFTGNLRYVPLKLTVTFNDKDALLSFIDNVEKKVFPNPAYRVLYKIDNVSYDIANYTTQQNADITLNAYYYTD
jgi:hypothetical protein